MPHNANAPLGGVDAETAYENSKSALGRKNCGDGYTALCPIHDDRVPSLNVKVAGNKLLVHCHGGCSQSSITEYFKGQGWWPSQANASRFPKTSRSRVENAALSLQEYAKEKGFNPSFLSQLGLTECRIGGIQCLRIPYYRDDREVGVRLRSRTAEGGRKMMWKKGTKAKGLLYGEDRISTCEGNVLLVEGESDCHTAWLFGIPCIGMPGVDSWDDERICAVLAGFDRIDVLIEPDQGGETFLRHARNSRLAEVMRAVTLGKHKDLNDLFLAVGSDLFPEHLKEYRDQATPVWLTEHPTASEKHPPTKSRYFYSMETIKAERIDWIWPGMIAKGKTHILVGQKGLGKSTILFNWAAIVSRGGCFPGETASVSTQKTLVITAKDGIADTVRPRLEAVNAQMGNVLNMPPLMPDGRLFNIVEHFEILEGIIQEQKVSLVLLDPITAFVGDQTDNNNPTQVRAIMARLARMAERTHAAIICLTHPTKAKHSNLETRVLGSGAWTHAARIVLGVIDNEDCGPMVGVLNANITSSKGVYPYELGPVMVGEDEDIEAYRVVWGDPMLDRKLTEFEDFQEPKHGRLTSEASAIISEVLGKGPHPFGYVRDELKARGINVRTGQRAAEELGVIIDRSGTAGGSTIWSLPEETPFDLRGR